MEREHLSIRDLFYTGERKRKRNDAEDYASKVNWILFLELEKVFYFQPYMGEIFHLVEPVLITIRVAVCTDNFCDS